MTAFLKIDRCQACRQETPWEWVPPLHVAGRLLAGTGVWRSALADGLCTRCAGVAESARRQERRTQILREEFSRLLGGARPCREFTFQRYQVTPENRGAVHYAERFDPARDNLYLWGSCGVGKTHLAIAILRRWFARGASVAMATPFQLIRKLRMKTPEEEQQAIDRFICVNALVIDDLGAGADSAYGRQLLQEILDGRAFNDRGGLIVTGPHSLIALARRLNDRAIPSRLAGMCRVVEIRGVDHRQAQSPRSDRGD